MELKKFLETFTVNRKLIVLDIVILALIIAGLDTITPPEVPTDALYGLLIWLGLLGWNFWGGQVVIHLSILLFSVSNYLISADTNRNFWPAVVLVYLLFQLFNYAAYRFLLNQRQLTQIRHNLQTRLAELDQLYTDLQALHPQQLKLAVSEERNRLAREIHDVLAQGLAAILFQVEAAYVSREDLPALEERLQQISELAHHNLQEARRSVANLRPLPLDDTSLVEALKHKVEIFSKEQNIQAVFSTTGVIRNLSSEAERACYRIAQEALTNVARHAGASQVQVMLDYDEEEVCLTVADNGVGFEPPSAVFPGHSDTDTEGEVFWGTQEFFQHRTTYGLRTIQERAGLIGGLTTIQSKPGQGCRVRVIVPYNKTMPLSYNLNELTLLPD